MYGNSALSSSGMNWGAGRRPPRLVYRTPSSAPMTDHNYHPYLTPTAAQTPSGFSSMPLDPQGLINQVSQLRWEKAELQRKVDESTNRASYLDLKLKTTEKEVQNWKEQTSKLECELQALKETATNNNLISRELDSLKVLTENWAHQLRRVCNFHIWVPSTPKELIQTRFMDTLIGHVRELLAPEDEKQLWRSFTDCVAKPSAVPSTSFEAPQGNEQLEVFRSAAETPKQVLRKKLPSKERRQGGLSRKPTGIHRKTTKYFKCQKCPSSFGKLARLRVHMASDHDTHSYMEGMLGCKKCGGIFPTNKSFRHHLASEHGIPLGRRNRKKTPTSGVYEADAETNDQSDFPLESQ